jgi:ElaB/YqjD/DUF883 family membrane-anchored ribosome-binding protein
MWSMGYILSKVGSWAITGWERNKSNHSKQWSQSDLFPQRSKSATETGEHESWLREKARNSKQDLLRALADEPDSLTKSIAESVIAPMLEPQDKQPSWKWLREKAQALLDDTRDTLNGYKKTVMKAASPLLSFVRFKIKNTCISSTLATDGRSDQTEIFDPPPEDDPDGSGVENDGHGKDADIDPNVSTDVAGCSY